jgi:hypothetical protein
LPRRADTGQAPRSPRRSAARSVHSARRRMSWTSTMSTGSAITTRSRSAARSTWGTGSSRPRRSPPPTAPSYGRVRPGWFSSGPVGDPPRPGESDAVDVKEIVAAAGAREHRLFAGKLDKSKLSFRERAVIRAVGGHGGDYRDWDEIRGWAEAIATSLNVVDKPAREPAISTGTQPIGRQEGPVSGTVPAETACAPALVAR